MAKKQQPAAQPPRVPTWASNPPLSEWNPLEENHDYTVCAFGEAGAYQLPMCSKCPPQRAGRCAQSAFRPLNIALGLSVDETTQPLRQYLANGHARYPDGRPLLHPVHGRPIRVPLVPSEDGMTKSSTELARIAEPTIDMPIGEVAKHFHLSRFFKDATDESKAIVKIIFGRELGIGPVAAMTGIYVVDGKLTMGANLIAAAIKRSQRYTYRVTDCTQRGCTIVFFEFIEQNGKIEREQIGVSEFSENDARMAGLLGKGNWSKFPKAMYFARAMSQGARMHTPEVFSGPVYTPDELGAEVDLDEHGNINTVRGRPVDEQPIAEELKAKPLDKTIDDEEEASYQIHDGDEPGDMGEPTLTTEEAVRSNPAAYPEWTEDMLQGISTKAQWDLAPSPGHKIVHCRSCNAPIVWGRLKKHSHPFNLDGISHFATCPNADSHRSEPRESKSQGATTDYHLPEKAVWQRVMPTTGFQPFSDELEGADGFKAAQALLSKLQKAGTAMVGYTAYEWPSLRDSVTVAQKLLHTVQGLKAETIASYRDMWSALCGNLLGYTTITTPDGAYEGWRLPYGPMKEGQAVAGYFDIVYALATKYDQEKIDLVCEVFFTEWINQLAKQAELVGEDTEGGLFDDAGEGESQPPKSAASSQLLGPAGVADAVSPLNGRSITAWAEDLWERDETLRNAKVMPVNPGPRKGVSEWRELSSLSEVFLLFSQALLWNDTAQKVPTPGKLGMMPRSNAYLVMGSDERCTELLHAFIDAGQHVVASFNKPAHRRPLA